MTDEIRLIDANALLEKAWDVPFETNDAHFVKVIDVGDVEEAKTIDPEILRPTGRWVDLKWNDMWQSMTATCSHCLERGEVRVRTNEYGMKVINSPCCPNCGAKMEA